jgi:hypothetical protein
VRAGYLIDTDWIIDHLNGVAAVTARLHELRSVDLAVSIIPLAELYIVEMYPAGQPGPPVGGAAIGPHIRPLPQQRLDKPLRLAISARGVSRVKSCRSPRAVQPAPNSRERNADPLS